MQDDIIVESGIPIPARPKPANARYPFDELAVGDSFPVPGDVTPNAMRATARYHAKKLGRAFTVRTDGASYRLWRTA